MQKILETAKNQGKVLETGDKKYLKPIAVFQKSCLFINMLMYRLIMAYSSTATLMNLHRNIEISRNLGCEPLGKLLGSIIKNINKGGLK